MSSQSSSLSEALLQDQRECWRRGQCVLVESFLERHPEFASCAVRDVWTEVIRTEPPSGVEQFFRTTPRATGSDGFFTAVMQRAA